MLELTAVQLTPPGPVERPLLIVGPSLGTSVSAVWGACAGALSSRYDVVGWELPGHGVGPAADAAFTVADLASAVAALIGRVTAERARPGESVAYAGVSLGGTVGLRLGIDRPALVTSLALLCTGAKIGTPESWQERADAVRVQGTSSLIEASAKRWFAPGFTDRDPTTAATLLTALADTDDASYAWACEALAGFDVRDLLSQITTPVLTIAGAHDVATPPSSLALIASGVLDAQSVVLDDAAHLACAELPAVVAAHLLARAPRVGATRVAGMAVRRAVLGEAHVDRAGAAVTDVTRDFQDLITRYAWGEVWTRPGLSRRDRSVITLTALVAGGHLEELALHIAAARRNGLSADEISEVLLQTAIYCSVPAANSAFRVAHKVLAEPIDGVPPSD